MAVSKVIFNSNALMDVTQDTVVSDKLHIGYTATGADGNSVSGSYVVPVYQSKTVDPTTSQQVISPDSNYNALSSVTVNAVALESKTVTPSSSSQSVTPTSPNLGLSSVTVNAIPGEYIIPTGTINVTSNGTVNVTQYASANVAVPVGTDVQDATATQDEICLNKTAYIATGKTTGTGDMVHTLGSVPSAQDTSIIHVNSDYYAWRGNAAIPHSGMVRFIDYDGTVLHAYTCDEALELSALPANPTHTDMGLTSQGWNWTLSEIKSYLNLYPNGDVTVGQMYVTTSGATEIDIELYEERKSPYLRISVNGTISIDWGDSTTPTTETGNSLTVIKNIQHQYTSGGSYTIKITVSSGKASFYRGASGSSSYYLLLNNNHNSSTSYNSVYANAVKAVRIGTDMTLGGYAFMMLYSLKYVTMPQTGITQINTYDFNSCGIKSLTIPTSVTSIGSYAVGQNYSINNISIPNSVTTIQNNALSEMTCVKSICIPTSVTTIQNSSFSGCRSLEQIIIPATVTSIGSSILGACTGLKNLFFYGNSNGYATSNACVNCYNLNNVVFSDNVKHIGEYSFQNCYSLDTVSFSGAMEGIWSYAFSNCYSLGSVFFADGGENAFRINNYAFNNCHSLSSVRLPEDMEYIGNFAFYSCSNLETINLPNTNAFMGNSAFSDSGLRSLVIPDELYSFEKSVFRDTPISSLTLSSNMTTITDNMFYGCNQLPFVDIPENVTSIGQYAFAYCRELSSVVLHNGLESIGDHAFESDNGLQEIVIPNTVTSIAASAFSGCSSLKSISLSSNMSSISASMVYACYALRSIDIPGGITSIGNSAFKYCYALSKLTIPSGVTSIGTSALSDCYGIKEFHFLSTTPPTLGTNVFTNSASDVVIYVPYSSDHSILAEYQEASNWADYASYMQEEPQS